MNIETSGYVGAGSPDLDLAIAVEMSQVGASQLAPPQNLSKLEIARDSFCQGSGCEAV